VSEMTSVTSRAQQ